MWMIMYDHVKTHVIIHIVIACSISGCNCWELGKILDTGHLCFLTGVLYKQLFSFGSKIGWSRGPHTGTPTERSGTEVASTSGTAFGNQVSQMYMDKNAGDAQPSQLLRYANKASIQVSYSNHATLCTCSNTWKSHDHKAASAHVRTWWYMYMHVSVCRVLFQV